MVTDEQVRLLRRKRRSGKSQQAAAAAAGLVTRTARRHEEGPLPSERKKRHWRTRADPFEGVWAEEVVPLLERDREGKLEAKTLLEELMERYPGRFTHGHLRTLQRRVRKWRALQGPDKPVVFPQVHAPGREAAVDFTHGTELGVTVRGEPLAHLVFEFKLSFSGWTWVKLAYGETFEALVEGLQGALWALGGVPEVVRHDNLSAAVHELKRSQGRSLTRRFQGVLDHYGMRSTRIRPGESHENGVAEKAHELLKRAVKQALLLRGSRDFDSPEAYEHFLREVIERKRNAPVADQLAEERQHLRPLPSVPVPNYSRQWLRVKSSSTVRVGGRAYSVPSRLEGHQVCVDQYADHVEVYYGDTLVETMPRLRGERDARIDYRHVIGSLVRKPGAFACYRFREELFPSHVFRRAYDALRDWRGERADIEYVRILNLAATTMESRVEAALADLLADGERFDYARVKDLVEPEPSQVPDVSIGQPDLSVYDRFLGGSP